MLTPRFRGAVAQLGERLVRNEEVDGSIPFSSTIPNGSNRAASVLREIEKKPAKPSFLSDPKGREIPLVKDPFVG